MSRVAVVGLALAVLGLTGCTADQGPEPQAEPDATTAAPSEAPSESAPDPSAWDDLTNCPHFAFTLDDAERMSFLDEAQGRGLVEESSQELMVAIRDACLEDDSQQIGDVAASVAGGNASSPSAVDADGAAGSGVCGEYFTTLAEPYKSAEGASFEELNPAELSEPWGFDVPTADCVARVTPGNGFYQFYLGWEGTDFATILGALEAGGMVVIDSFEDGDVRKYQISNGDGTGLFWLDSGEGIYPGVPTDDILFVWGE